MHTPRFGIAGAISWAMPPWQRTERVRALAVSRLGVDITAVLTGINPIHVRRLIESAS
jgi:hypothetical protein